MSIFLSYPLKLIEDKLDDKACLFLSANINLCKIILWLKAFLFAVINIWLAKKYRH
jgi:hypothetical protein